MRMHLQQLLIARHNSRDAAHVDDMLANGFDIQARAAQQEDDFVAELFLYSDAPFFNGRFCHLRSCLLPTPYTCVAPRSA